MNGFIPIVLNQKLNTSPYLNSSQMTDNNNIMYTSTALPLPLISPSIASFSNEQFLFYQNQQIINSNFNTFNNPYGQEIYSIDNQSLNSSYNTFRSNSSQTITELYNNFNIKNVDNSKNKKVKRLNGSQDQHVVSNNNFVNKRKKNALMILHELKPIAEFRLVDKSGPSHKPKFKMSIDLDGCQYEGEGGTKKEAKMQAALKAIEFLHSSKK
jgi:hypothetical protein